jgi:hypothetical protein
MLGHVALRFPYEGEQSKRQVALWLGHSQAWPKASLGLAGQDLK